MSHGLHPGMCKVCHSSILVHEGVKLVKGCRTSEKLACHVSVAMLAGTMHDTYVRYKGHMGSYQCHHICVRKHVCLSDHCVCMRKMDVHIVCG